MSRSMRTASAAVPPSVAAEFAEFAPCARAACVSAEIDSRRQRKDARNLCVFIQPPRGFGGFAYRFSAQSLKWLKYRLYYHHVRQSATLFQRYTRFLLYSHLESTRD